MELMVSVFSAPGWANPHQLHASNGFWNHPFLHWHVPPPIHTCSVDWWGVLTHFRVPQLQAHDRLEVFFDDLSHPDPCGHVCVSVGESLFHLFNACLCHTVTGNKADVPIPPSGSP